MNNKGFKPETELPAQKSEHLSGYLELHPKAVSREMVYGIKPHYKINSGMLLSLASAVDNRNFSESSMQLAGLARRPEIEKEMRLAGETINPKEIADANFREMERATALKWYVTLNRLFSAEHFKKVPQRSSDGRIKIALPGCNLGFEIGGILDFFNEQGIPVDIEAVDIAAAGTEQQFMRLEERTKIVGSTVNFRPQTDAREFFRDKPSDLVILRHPGFVFEPDEYYVWKEIVSKLTETRPGLVIVSTYNHTLEDPAFIEMVVGEKDKDKIFEGEVFDKWLAEQGYKTTEDYNAFWNSGALEYPMSPYMIAFEKDGDKLKYTLPVDVDMVIYGSEEYFADTTPISTQGEPPPTTTLV